MPYRTQAELYIRLHDQAQRGEQALHSLRSGVSHVLCGACKILDTCWLTMSVLRLAQSPAHFLRIYSQV